MIVFIFFSLGSYVLSCSGVIPQIQEALSISKHCCTIPGQEIELAGINKVILSCREGTLDLHGISGNKLTILGQVEIQASSSEAAEALALQALAEIKTVGDTLYIRINRAPGQGNIFRSDHGRSGRIIFVPARIPLEVTCPGFGIGVQPLP